MELKTWKMNIFHLFADLYSADGVCKGHVRGQLRRENFDELQKALLFFLENLHFLGIWYFS